MLIAEGCAGGFWCVASSPIASTTLALLGPTAAVWFWQVSRTKAYENLQGAQTQIAKARDYASCAKWWLIPVVIFWIFTVVCYSESYVVLGGKGCDATFTSSANLWVLLFGLSLIPLTVSFIGLGYQHLQFRKYDDAARALARPPE